MKDERDDTTKTEGEAEAERMLVPLSASSDAGVDSVAERLQHGVYADLPASVVQVVEGHRIAATEDYLAHMRVIRDKLAPYGNFKDWSTQAGLNYTALMKALSRRYGTIAPDTRESHSKGAVDAASTGSLPTPSYPDGEVAELPTLPTNGLQTVTDSTEPDALLRWIAARMELNTERTGHPLHHLTAGQPRGERVVLNGDPTLDHFGIRRYYTLRTGEEWEPFEPDDAPDDAPDDTPDDTPDDMEGYVEIYTRLLHSRLADGAYLHALRRSYARVSPGGDFRVVLALHQLRSAPEDCPCLSELAAHLEFAAADMRLAEELGLAELLPADASPAHEGALDTAITRILTRERVEQLWQQHIVSAVEE